MGPLCLIRLGTPGLVHPALNVTLSQHRLSQFFHVCASVHSFTFSFTFHLHEVTFTFSYLNHLCRSTSCLVSRTIQSRIVSDLQSDRIAGRSCLRFAVHHLHYRRLATELVRVRLPSPLQQIHRSNPFKGCRIAWWIGSTTAFQLCLCRTL